MNDKDTAGNATENSKSKLNDALGARWVEAQIYDPATRQRLPTEGVFHCWGSEYEEFENGAATYTVAIIEASDGQIHTVLPSYVRFLST